MADYLRIPDGNCMRFVRTDNQSSNKPDYTTRLHHQLAGLAFINKEGYMAFDIGEDIKLEIITNYDYDLTLHNALTDAEVTLAYSVTTPYSYYTAAYEYVDVDVFTIDTALLGGNYYLKFEFYPEGSSDSISETWQSENISIIKIDDEEHINIKCTSQGDFGMYGGEDVDFSFYVPGRNLKMQLGQDKILSKSYDGQINNLRGIAHLFCMLELADMPFWIFEKLNLASLHDSFYINDIEYQNEEPFTPIAQGDNLTMTSHYTGSILFRKKEYQKYIELENIEEPDIYPIWADTNEYRIYIDADENYIIYQEET